MSESESPAGHRLGLRAGEWVEVRTADEILTTLDDRGRLDALPFMPEMLKYCGKRFRVIKSAHKTCDTIERYNGRRMTNAVHLEGLRCDGEAHGGCQARCLLFWKEAWLKRVTRRELYAHPVKLAVRPAARATTPLEWWDPRQYLKDLTSRNQRLRDLIWYGMIALYNVVMRLHWRGRPYPYVRGLAEGTTPTIVLNLQPGELVQVRSRDEIMPTINVNRKNRGLSFDVEMVPYCGKTFRVLSRVERIVNEKTGAMIRMPNACIILEGVTCSGCFSDNRLFCPRSMYPYWREIWLKRVESTDPSAQ